MSSRSAHQATASVAALSDAAGGSALQTPRCGTQVVLMQPAVTEPALPTPRRRVPLWWWPAALFAVAIAGYSLRYGIVGERAYGPEQAESFRARPLTVAVHTLFGPIALVLGLVNLLP